MRAPPFVWVLVHLTTYSPNGIDHPQPFYLTAKECEKVIAQMQPKTRTDNASVTDYACLPVKYPSFESILDTD